jgi:hypothetical protein
VAVLEPVNHVSFKLDSAIIEKDLNAVALDFITGEIPSIDRLPIGVIDNAQSVSLTIYHVTFEFEHSIFVEGPYVLAYWFEQNSKLPFMRLFEKLASNLSMPVS